MIERDDYCIDILQQTAALRRCRCCLIAGHGGITSPAACGTPVATGDANAYTEEVMDVVRRSMGRPVRTARPASD
jgi:hypothetical protein